MTTLCERVNLSLTKDSKPMDVAVTQSEVVTKSTIADRMTHPDILGHIALFCSPPTLCNLARLDRGTNGLITPRLYKRVTSRKTAPPDQPVGDAADGWIAKPAPPRDVFTNIFEDPQDHEPYWERVITLPSVGTAHTEILHVAGGFKSLILAPGIEGKFAKLKIAIIEDRSGHPLVDLRLNSSSQGGDPDSAVDPESTPFISTIIMSNMQDMRRIRPTVDIPGADHLMPDGTMVYALKANVLLSQRGELPMPIWFSFEGKAAGIDVYYIIQGDCASCGEDVIEQTARILASHAKMVRSQILGVHGDQIHLWEAALAGKDVNKEICRRTGTTGEIKVVDRPWAVAFAGKEPRDWL